MPEHLVRFRLEDWCDPAAEPPEWWRSANESRDGWSLAGTETVESYWYLHARMAYQRARRAWLDAAASPMAPQ